MSHHIPTGIRFNFMHAELTSDQIDAYWTEEAKIEKTRQANYNIPAEYAPSKGMTDLESFQATAWTSALESEWTA